MMKRYEGVNPSIYGNPSSFGSGGAQNIGSNSAIGSVESAVNRYVTKFNDSNLNGFTIPSAEDYAKEQDNSIDSSLLTGSRDLDLDFLRNVYLMNVQNAYNEQSINAYRSWLESMSNSAYQRQALDLKKAGYNPGLALNGGGASVPSSGYNSSATASSHTPGNYNLQKSQLYIRGINSILTAFEVFAKYIDAIMPDSVF